MRSRGSSLPRARCRATVRAFLSGSAVPPPAVSWPYSPSISARAASRASRLAAKSSERGSTCVRRIGAMNLTLASS